MVLNLFVVHWTIPLFTFLLYIQLLPFSIVAFGLALYSINDYYSKLHPIPLLIFCHQFLELNVVLGLLLTLTYVPFGPYLLFLNFVSGYYLSLCLFSLVLMNLIYHATNILSIYFFKILLYFLFCLSPCYNCLYFLIIDTCLENLLRFYLYLHVLQLGSQIPSSYPVPSIVKSG